MERGGEPENEIRLPMSNTPRCLPNQVIGFIKENSPPPPKKNISKEQPPHTPSLLPPCCEQYCDIAGNGLLRSDMTLKWVTESQSGTACGDVFVCNIFTHIYSNKAFVLPTLQNTVLHYAVILK